MAENPNQRMSSEVAAKSRHDLVGVFETAVKQWWHINGRKMTSLCGSEDMARKLLVTAINVVSKNPRLAECEFQTFASCLLQSAELNLFPGALEEVAYVPLNNNKTKRLECNFWPMYKGLTKLAYNSGFVKSISCEVVYDSDEFEFELGTHQFLRHRPFLGDIKERGNRTCAYCVINTSTGDSVIKVVSIGFIDGIKSRAPGGGKPESPWNASDDSYDAMCRKTVFKQAAKFIPKSDKLAQAIEADSRFDNEDATRTKMLDGSKILASISVPAAASSLDTGMDIPTNAGSSDAA